MLNTVRFKCLWNLDYSRTHSRFKKFLLFVISSKPESLHICGERGPSDSFCCSWLFLMRKKQSFCKKKSRNSIVTSSELCNFCCLNDANCIRKIVRIHFGVGNELCIHIDMYMPMYVWKWKLTEFVNIGNLLNRWKCLQDKWYVKSDSM